MNAIMRNALAVTAVAISTQAAAEIIFYERENFHGQSFSTQKPVNNFGRSGFNDRASSVVALGERWEVCEDARFAGRCVILRPGRYPSLASRGLNDRISSVRPVRSNAHIAENRYAPAPTPVYDNRRRNNERLYSADVTSVHAVVGPPEQRCWIEHEQVPQDRNANVSVPGALVGAVIGGVLGHQVGSGTGNTVATVGGAVAGGAVGSQVGRLGGGQQQAQTRDIQRCASVPSQAPDHWDVTYNFRGQEHRMQMTTPPGQTVTVNDRGEPRA